MGPLRTSGPNPGFGYLACIGTTSPFLVGPFSPTLLFYLPPSSVLVVWEAPYEAKVSSTTPEVARCNLLVDYTPCRIFGVPRRVPRRHFVRCNCNVRPHRPALGLYGDWYTATLSRTLIALPRRQVVRCNCDVRPHRPTLGSYGAWYTVKLSRTLTAIPWLLAAFPRAALRKEVGGGGGRLVYRDSSS